VAHLQKSLKKGSPLFRAFPRRSGKNPPKIVFCCCRFYSVFLANAAEILASVQHRKGSITPINSPLSFKIYQDFPGDLSRNPSAEIFLKDQKGRNLSKGTVLIPQRKSDRTS
jgi:hypothetical protein